VQNLGITLRIWLKSNATSGSRFLLLRKDYHIRITMIINKHILFSIIITILFIDFLIDFDNTNTNTNK